MRGEINRIDAPATEIYNKFKKAGKDDAARGAYTNHIARQDAQNLLREAITWWAGHQNYDKATKYRKFYHQFGIDIATAQALGRKEAEALAIKINKSIDTSVNNV